MFDRNETHNSKGKQALHSVFARAAGLRRARPEGVDGVAMIRHQLPLQTAFLAW